MDLMLPGLNFSREMGIRKLGNQLLRFFFLKKKIVSVRAGEMAQ